MNKTNLKILSDSVFTTNGKGEIDGVDVRDFMSIVIQSINTIDEVVNGFDSDRIDIPASANTVRLLKERLDSFVSGGGEIYTKAEVDAAHTFLNGLINTNIENIAKKSDLTHNHKLDELEEKSFNSLTDKPFIPTKDSFDNKLDSDAVAADSLKLGGKDANTFVSKSEKGIIGGYVPVGDKGEVDSIFISEEVYQNAGIVDPTDYIVDNKNGTINMLESTVSIYANDEYKGKLLQFSVPALDGISLTDLKENYVIVNYNSGSPEYRVVLSDASINESNVIPIATILRASNRLYITPWANLSEGLPNKLHARLVKTERYKIEQGLNGSIGTSDEVLVGNGVVWLGGIRMELPAFSSSNSVGSLFDVHMHNSSDEWVFSGSLPKAPIGKYDDKSGTLAQTPSDKYCVSWFYRYVGIDRNYVTALLDEHLFTSLEDARAHELSVGKPPYIDTQYVYIGRLISKGDSSEKYFDRVAKISYNTSAVTSHDSLSNVQGNGQIHISNTEYSHFDEAYNHASAAHAPSDAYGKSAMDALLATKLGLNSITSDLSETGKAASIESVKTLKDSIIGGLNVENSLTSSSITKYLSANQGKILSLGKLDKSAIVNDLTTGGIDKVLSAEQGKILNSSKINVSNITDSLTSTDSTKVASAASTRILKNSIDGKIDASAIKTDFSGGVSNVASAEETKMLKSLIDNAINISVIDALDSSSITNALSANQGLVLNTKITKLREDKADKNGDATQDFSSRYAIAEKYTSGVGATRVHQIYDRLYATTNTDETAYGDLALNFDKTILAKPDGVVEAKSYQLVGSDSGNVTGIADTTNKWILGSDSHITGGSDNDFGIYSYLGSVALYNKGIKKLETTNEGIIASGIVRADNFLLNSDRRLKEEISSISFENAPKIESVNYKMISDKTHTLRNGYIAQQVRKTHPHLVHSDKNGILSVDYIGVLIEKVASLENEIKLLKGGN